VVSDELTGLVLMTQLVTAALPPVVAVTPAAGPVIVNVPPALAGQGDRLRRGEHGAELRKTLTHLLRKT
jgi:hypothetical protein